MLNAQMNTSVVAVENVQILVSYTRFDAFKSLTFFYVVTLQVYPHISLPFFPFLLFPFLSTFPFSLNLILR